MLATSCCHATCTFCFGLYCTIPETSIASILVMLLTVHSCKSCCLMQAKPLSLNSIHCNPCRPWQFTVAGGDAYVRVYDRRKAEAASCSAEEEQGDAAASTRSFAAALATPVSSSACRHTDYDSVSCQHQCFPCNRKYKSPGAIVYHIDNDKLGGQISEVGWLVWSSLWQDSTNISYAAFLLCSRVLVSVASSWTADPCHAACCACATYCIEDQQECPCPWQCQWPALDVSLLFQVRKLAPKHMRNDEARNAARHAYVTCANFSRQGEIVATYNDEVHIVQSCTSTCVCSPTASDIIPWQIASSVAERIVTTPTVCMLQWDKALSIYMPDSPSCKLCHSTYFYVYALQHTAPAFHLLSHPLAVRLCSVACDAQMHKSVWDSRILSVSGI